MKSLFGLGGGALETQPPAEASGGSSEKRPARSIIVWADLKSGFIGFPAGLQVEGGLPGSVMKLVAAACVSEEGLVNPNEEIACNGHASFGRRKFHCMAAHGRVNLVKALAHSCNVYFATISERLSREMFISYARKMGLDAPVGKYPSGLFPAKPGGQTVDYVLGLASDLKPNALQLLRLSALVATRGAPPYLHSTDESADGRQGFNVHLEDGTWSRLRTGMQLAVKEGTAHKLDPDNKMHIAAKTGTTPHGTKFQSWITGYFPCDDPRHAFCLGSPAGTSQDSAVPQAREFLFATTWP